jgi:hypothetical protein
MDGAGELGAAGRETHRQARSGSGWYAWVARAGLVAKGVSFGIVGALAFKLAIGAGLRHPCRVTSTAATFRTDP